MHNLVAFYKKKIDTIRDDFKIFTLYENKIIPQRRTEETKKSNQFKPAKDKTRINIIFPLTTCHEKEKMMLSALSSYINVYFII